MSVWAWPSQMMLMIQSWWISCSFMLLCLTGVKAHHLMPQCMQKTWCSVHAEHHKQQCPALMQAQSAPMASSSGWSRWRSVGGKLRIFAVLIPPENGIDTVYPAAGCRILLSPVSSCTWSQTHPKRSLHGPSDFMALPLAGLDLLAHSVS